MAKFIMFVGLPASGKSTIASVMEKVNQNTVWISSDNLREEIHGDVNNQDNPAMIFQEMAKRTKEALKEGKDVAYDATNISRKKRRGLLQQLPKDVYKEVNYVATDFDMALSMNKMRERVVPHHVMKSMYKSLQIPIYEEGWDEINFLYNGFSLKSYEMQDWQTEYLKCLVMRNDIGYKIMGELAKFIDIFSKTLDLAQDSKYHSFSVSRHIYYVYDYVHKNYHGEDKELMYWVALLHDQGKYFCKSFENRKREETRYANFIGHEYVSSQLAVFILKNLGYDNDFIHKATTLIQFHMYLLDQNASRDKLLRQVGQDMFDKLEFLREADTLAH
ncbi:polynucleotide kinase [Bacillus phage vB_BanS-Thrax3]|nr:polynucleotide kinase [Bacillus phage vB_BanS-Thrax3]